MPARMHSLDAQSALHALVTLTATLLPLHVSTLDTPVLCLTIKKKKTQNQKSLYMPYFDSLGTNTSTKNAQKFILEHFHPHYNTQSHVNMRRRRRF